METHGARRDEERKKLLTGVSTCVCADHRQGRIDVLEKREERVSVNRRRREGWLRWRGRSTHYL